MPRFLVLATANEARRVKALSSKNFTLILAGDILPDIWYLIDSKDKNIVQCGFWSCLACRRYFHIDAKNRLPGLGVVRNRMIIRDKYCIGTLFA